ncbi:MAG TPA: hypothetical protein VEC10_08685, partial [Steroidobacteraceae bacterium]|nr:hypothetical protein [Steroidobacteraceae bacterium]
MASYGDQRAPRRQWRRVTTALATALAAALAASGSFAVGAASADAVQTQMAAAIAADGSLIRGRARQHGAAQALRTVYANRADMPLWSRE